MNLKEILIVAATGLAVCLSPAGWSAECPAAYATSEPAVQAAAWHDCGAAALRAGDHDDAAIWLREAVLRVPEDAASLSDLSLLSVRLNRHVDALAFGRAAIAHAAGSGAARLRAAAHYNMARSYEQRGYTAEALGHYVAAQRELPARVYERAIVRVSIAQTPLPGASL